MDDEPIDRRRHRALAGASRVRVLEVLRARGAALTVPELARELGLHPNTVRLHLQHLAEVELVRQERVVRSGPGRPHLLFTASRPAAGPVAPGSGEEAEGYRLLATVLAGHLADAGEGAEAEAVSAGRAWGRGRTPPAGPATAAGAVDHLVDMLDDLGFAPSPLTADGAVDLHRCPFLQVAEQHSAVVCGVHLGLAQGTLDRLDTPVRATAIQPFVAPGRCRLQLALPDRPLHHPAPDGQGSTPAPPTEGLLR